MSAASLKKSALQFRAEQDIKIFREKKNGNAIKVGIKCRGHKAIYRSRLAAKAMEHYVCSTQVFVNENSSLDSIKCTELLIAL